MTIDIYLTIDDSPSMDMDKKVEFLKRHNISTIFYSRGEHIRKYPEQIINAIKNGFLIGNHSYTHPHFSQISIDDCFNEVLKTEQVINACYDAAKVARPYKVIRFPFGDRGGTKDRVSAIQHFLETNKFSRVEFNNIIGNFIDAGWDWDTEDYKTKHIDNVELYLHKMQDFLKNYTKHSATLLLHDFDTNHHLFESSMKFLIDNDVRFLNYQILQ